MRRLKFPWFKWQVIAVGKLFLVLLFLSVCALAQRPKPKVHGVFDGDTMYAVLPPDAIPAILNPSFVSGDEAVKQMNAEEPVLGVIVNGEARAYSLWQLDAHEIVNDSLGGIPIAATW